MLVLSRKSGEKIHIGTDIVVTVLEIRAGQIRLGIDAPPSVRVLRGELLPAADTQKQPQPKSPASV